MPSIRFPVFLRVTWGAHRHEATIPWKIYSHRMGWKKRLKRKLCFAETFQDFQINLQLQQKVGTGILLVGRITIPFEQFCTELSPNMKLPHTKKIQIPVQTNDGSSNATVSITLSASTIYTKMISLDQQTNSTMSSIHLDVKAISSNGSDRSRKDESQVYPFFSPEDVYAATLSKSLSINQLLALRPILDQQIVDTLYLPQDTDETLEAYLYSIDLLRAVERNPERGSNSTWIVRTKVFDMIAFKRCLREALNHPSNSHIEVQCQVIG